MGVGRVCPAPPALHLAVMLGIGYMARMTWPNTIPEDLRRILTGTLATRSVGPAEVWGDLRDWLIQHGVEPPAHPLPEYQPPDRAADQ